MGLAYAGRGAGAVLAGLVVSLGIRRLARRRIGGMTGDVFGAVIEGCTVTVLITMAFST